MKKRRKKTNKLANVIGIVLFVLIAWLLLDANVKVNTETQIVEVRTIYQDTNPVATLFGINISGFVQKHGEVNTNFLGEYERTYQSFLFNEEYKKIVKVIDSRAPLIELVDSSVIYLEDINSYQEPGFIATDNYDGNITANVTQELIKVSEGLYEIEYNVTDSSGNRANRKRTVKEYAGTVYLTFDDGPSHNNTPKILDILKAKDVTATFFVVNFDETKKEIINRMVEEGHTVGLHGMSHEYSKIYTSVDAIMNNFYEIENLVSETTDGYTSKVIRFPGGSSNTISKNYCKGVMTYAAQRATKEGYMYFDWNVDSGDAGGASTPEQIYQNVISGIKKNRHNVILMHDAGSKENTVLALEKIIDYCIENEYCVKAIDSKTTQVHHGISN